MAMLENFAYYITTLNCLIICMHLISKLYFFEFGLQTMGAIKKLVYAFYADCVVPFCHARS